MLNYRISHCRKCSVKHEPNRLILSNLIEIPVWEAFLGVKKGHNKEKT